MTNSSPFIHSVPFPCSLHRAPVKFRIKFDVCLLTYKTSHKKQIVIFTPSWRHQSTSLEKDCIDILVTPIASIVKLSLSEGCFPSHFMSTLISPLLKKLTLNKDNLTNYRSVSNLSFLSKILEKVVANRLNLRINSSKLSNHYQSAYKNISLNWNCSS